MNIVIQLMLYLINFIRELKRNNTEHNEATCQ